MKIIFQLILFFVASLTFAQPGTNDASFNPGTGGNQEVLSIAVQNNGKILVGGFFSDFNGFSSDNIIRLNSDGSPDLFFPTGTGISGTPTPRVHDIAIQNDGKIILVGNFNAYNGQQGKNIVRINPDGTYDPTFNTGLGTTGNALGNIRCVSLQSDGKIIIGGEFTVFNGIAKNRIARLNTDGSLDLTFNSGTAANDIIFSTAVQGDGKIIIGGIFTSYAGTSVNRLARLNTDGTLDASFVTGSSANNAVRAIKLQADGKIVIGGDFITYNGVARNRIARVNVDGSIDPAFDPGLGFNASVYSMILQNDGKIVIGGDFTLFNGLSSSRIARLNTDASQDAIFLIGAGTNGYINATTIQNDGKILIGGFFTTYNGAARTSIARINGECIIPTITGTNGDSICGTGSAILSATSNSGTLNWYAASSGGTSLGTGASFTTPIISTTTTFYVDATNSGCSSSARTAVTAIVNQATTASLNEIGCDTYTWALNGTSYTNSGTYTHVGTNAAGCPLTTTLNLTINNSTTATVNQNECDTYTWALNGTTYTNSGTYTHVGTNAAGCPLTTTLNLTINNSTTATVNETACDSYTWALNGTNYTNSGTYIHVGTNAAGCDFTTTLNLTINSVNNATNLVGTTISANATGAAYQWVDCNSGNALINGATNQSYTPIANGNYAVIVSQNGCSSMSNCVIVNVVGVKEISLQNQVNVYPNPSNGLYTISGIKANTNLVVYNALGEEIYASITTGTSEQINLSALAKGIYFLRIAGPDDEETHKIIIQ
jgi:uncharacterized delta-60 repeat protein